MNPALAAAIRSAIKVIGASSASLTASSRAEALYEGYAFACVIEALARLNSTFELRDETDSPTRAVVFRTKPGLIYSGSPHTFVLVTMPDGAQYELHSDVRVLGRSQILHELDVALIDRDEGERCRRGRILPRQTKVRLLIECKFYGRTLPLRLGREFLGLSSEFSVRVKTMMSNVTNSNIKGLLISHRGTENFEVSPADPANVTMFVGWLAKELSQVL